MNFKIFTKAQGQHVETLSQVFESVALRHGWQRPRCTILAGKCVLFGLETLDRFPLTTLALFNWNLNLAANTSRIVFKAMEEEGIQFGPRGNDGMTDHQWANFHELKRRLLAVSETPIEEAHFGRIARRATLRGLENIERMSQVTRPFFDAVMRSKSDLPARLASRAMQMEGMAFRQ